MINPKCHSKEYITRIKGRPSKIIESIWSIMSELKCAVIWTSAIKSTQTFTKLPYTMSEISRDYQETHSQRY